MSRAMAGGALQGGLFPGLAADDLAVADPQRHGGALHGAVEYAVILRNNPE
ncbi:MAG: hypothetical protein JEZ12_02165 [Desulfobacterium sp.]|nr:hypothetical protein [Desulfobacterium sp.]